jgi:benzoyl-CoA reductase/2-hydroxyglutaryl-CoA dehydratase subunit BcrC/BadD/HgdB
MSECCGRKDPKDSRGAPDPASKSPCCSPGGPDREPCGGKKAPREEASPCEATASTCEGGSPCASTRPEASSEPRDASPLTWFSRMIPNCLEYAKKAKAEGKPIVGIMCEYTPRELIMAAGAVPVCLCGGSEKTIASAEEDLPANLCPLIKSTYGYHAQKSNPFLEMADVIVAETTCDGKKKMYELMSQTRPMYVLELPQKPDDADAFDHWQRELHKFRAELEERFGVEITDGRLRGAIEVMNRERALRRALADLMKADSPPLTGRELLELKSSISGIPCDFAQYERAISTLPGREAVPDAASRVRVLMTGAPMAHGAERVIEIIESHGGLVVAMENCVGLKPILDDVRLNGTDPMLALAEKYFTLPCSVMTANDRRLDTLSALANDHRAQCVIELVWQACLTYDVESYRVKRLAQEKLGIPYLRIETDYSPSDSARIAVRVEALFETVLAAADAGGGRKRTCEGG